MVWYALETRARPSKFKPMGASMYRKICLTAVVLFRFFSTPAFAQNAGLRKVNHIIIVMQENHSFDNYFGVLAYASGSPYRTGNGACAETDNRCVHGLTCSAAPPGSLP